MLPYHTGHRAWLKKVQVVGCHKACTVHQGVQDTVPWRAYTFLPTSAVARSVWRACAIAASPCALSEPFAPSPSHCMGL